MKIPPQEVIHAMASRAHRLHHYLWHQVRNSWHGYPDTTKEIIRNLGWEPPRPAFKIDGALATDNYSGEDFLYMHRKMIEFVNAILARIGNADYPRVEGWVTIPQPINPHFIVPPTWDSGIPSLNARLPIVKSDNYFADTIRVWESDFTNPSLLRRMTLGELGSRVEFTIHNNLHIRWCAKPNPGIRPNPGVNDPTAIPTQWDNPIYDFLGDTYSSHVNPHFWYLHGWVDSLIEKWKEANGLQDINWIGTWEGKLPQHQPEHHHVMGFLTSKEKSSLHDHHLHEMEMVAAAIKECGVHFQFYDGIFGV